MKTYLDMLAAITNGDQEAARRTALALKEHLGAGGDYPTDHLPDTVDNFIEIALAGGDMLAKVDFTLVCMTCDAGMEIDTQEQGEQAGWTDIEPGLDLSNANYIGTCPDCRK